MHSSLAVLLAVVLSLLDSCVAWHGSVHLYSDVNFGGSTARYAIDASQTCYALRAADVSKTASAKWESLVQNGTLGQDKQGHAMLGFYTNAKCQDVPAKTFSTKAENFPTNFALNGIKDKIASFLVLESSAAVNAIVSPN
ncbi:hypothetical protein BBJ28_00001542 [Nothophytophthora sp. Chile5]|nr:hypothetical protein BBJ28_00001542 [Nothophytophthora sp. Chile5]